MICLFFDTASEKLKVSLIKNDEIIYDKEMINKNDHSSYLVPFIDEAFKSNNIDFKDLDRIIVGIGPGSFTGTRISITVAKVYAAMFNIPLFGISSLEMMIYGDKDYDYYVPIIEEKKDNLYYGIYDKNKKRIVEDSYTSKEKLYEILSKYEGKILLISHNSSEYEKYEYTNEKIDPIEINKNILVNNKEENPHLLKPNYIKKIEAESKL